MRPCHTEVDLLGGGGSVKVTAELQQISDAISAGQQAVDTTRFAGFRGDEAVSAERVVLSVDAIAYASAIAAP